MKFLPDRETLLSFLSYDPETGIFLRTKPSGCVAAGTRADKPHRSHKRWYRVISIGGQNVYAHRLAFVMMEDRDPGPLVDHKDRDSENNRWRNLRESTNMLNQLNASHNRDIPHVYPSKDMKSWQIKVNGKYYGRRPNVDLAIKRRDEIYKEIGHAKTNVG